MACGDSGTRMTLACYLSVPRVPAAYMDAASYSTLLNLFGQTRLSRSVSASVVIIDHPQRPAQQLGAGFNPNPLEVFIMQINIQFRTDNAAFAESPENEAGRILEELAKMLRHDGLAPGNDIPLFDHNGNRVGEYTAA